ncbi:MAG: tryptophan--tRNA ligase [Leptospirales bacterium]|nr:tryptophan--tRNA ligase [Leptospirales bacterium]
MRILSGIQPSGRPHLGNYFSMMRRMVDYQQHHELFCFIASYHSLTSVGEGQTLAQNILETAADFLALGLDPARCVFWVQSDAPEVQELAWILSMHITAPQLELAHSYKDKVAQGITPSGGLFFYPVLMAADILLFQSDRVPVGKDQKQHLEFARDIARRFNLQYGDLLKIPEPDILEDVAVVPGVDGRKMSKSYNNAIYPFAPEKELRKAIMGIVTDSTPVDAPKPAEGTPLFEIYSLFLDERGRQDLARRFAEPGKGYGHFKQELFEIVLQHFQQQRQRREEIMRDPQALRELLHAGAAKARRSAAATLHSVRRAIGLDY